MECCICYQTINTIQLECHHSHILCITCIDNLRVLKCPLCKSEIDKYALFHEFFSRRVDTAYFISFLHFSFSCILVSFLPDNIGSMLIFFNMTQFIITIVFYLAIINNHYTLSIGFTIIIFIIITTKIYHSKFYFNQYHLVLSDTLLSIAFSAPFIMTFN